ncbi:hypothetical protein MXD61_15360 [Frankia sp. AgPm24]|uniref:hypothetical protein n=1 Tax=Frankia sp. AgPm24 TaxID=631128 RepID=UPI00200C69A6|nr:hypothetical protein [Frankia sp. AgPm24]MCK9923232.1 hypothetical protein [Frankia sp. AgPm24]
MSGARGRVYGRSGDRLDGRPGQDASDWFAARVPADWFTGPPEVVVDRDEITVVGELAAGSADGSGSAGGSGTSAPGEAGAGRIRRFRESTRDERVVIAGEAERRYGRKVAWGATSGQASELFTVLSVPVMTRLRQPERQVLDTLVDSGVARSRSEALAWCVRLVGDNADTWLRQLRDAMEHVEKIRAEGPGRQPGRD